MDWAAGLLGLDKIFLSGSGKGGGVIQVSLPAFIVFFDNSHSWKNRLLHPILPWLRSWLPAHVTPAPILKYPMNPWLCTPLLKHILLDLRRGKYLIWRYAPSKLKPWMGTLCVEVRWRQPWRRIWRMEITHSFSVWSRFLSHICLLSTSYLQSRRLERHLPVLLTIYQKLNKLVCWLARFPSFWPYYLYQLKIILPSGSTSTLLGQVSPSVAQNIARNYTLQKSTK